MEGSLKLITWSRVNPVHSTAFLDTPDRLNWVAGVRGRNFFFFVGNVDIN